VATFRAMVRFLVQFIRLSIRARRWPDDGLFLRAVYRACLRREPDEGGRRHYVAALESKRMSRWDVWRAVVHSEEHAQVGHLPVHPLDAIHRARMGMVQRWLPSTRVIVDLGGAATGRPEGALLAMGYPHRPESILIVDPLCASGPEPHVALTTREGVRVSHLCRSMADPLPLADESVDLVFCGESIEHVTEVEAEAVCREAFRICRPGGWFCLDTPNAALTRLQSPDALIHPEHKKEYHVSELRDLVARCGFEVVEVRGLCPMPESLARGEFCFDELVLGSGLPAEPETCYVVFLKAVKAAPACADASHST